MKRDEFIKKVTEQYKEDEEIVFQFPYKDQDGRSDIFDIRELDLSTTGKDGKLIHDVKKVIFIY